MRFDYHVEVDDGGGADRAFRFVSDEELAAGTSISNEAGHRFLVTIVELLPETIDVSDPDPTRFGRARARPMR